MSGELFTTAAKEIINIGKEVISESGDISELGAVKPRQYGSLIKKRFQESMTAESTQLGFQKELTVFDEIKVDFFGQRPKLNSKRPMAINKWLSLRPQEAAREAAAYLCDYAIIPERWNMADTDEKTAMLSQAVEIMGRELLLPDEWLNKIKPLIEEIPREDNENVTMAYASYTVRPLSNGGVEVASIPKLVINSLTLDLDYYKVMSTVYHEMIHIKQYASIDGVAPSMESDIRLLDLISDMRKKESGRSRVEYLSSPYEAEAWAQGMYFEEMLKAVVKENTV